MSLIHHLDLSDEQMEDLERESSYLACHTAGTMIYGDFLYGNLYAIPICYVELGIEILSTQMKMWMSGYLRHIMTHWSSALSSMPPLMRSLWHTAKVQM
jgi:hypothetical protein